MLTGVISYPVPAYSNPPIEPQFFQPSVFDISAITTGQSTTITTSENHNFVIGQLIRLLIPVLFGSYQLNGVQGYVISIPTNNSVVVQIDSSFVDAFIPSPYIATITNINVVDANSVNITANNSFRRGNVLLIYGVNGMTQINNMIGTVKTVSNTSFVLNIPTSGFSVYTSGGTAVLFDVPQNQAQIIAIGDVNQGIISSTGPVIPTTTIPGSFINISP
jgi:hypothetical protein